MTILVAIALGIMALGFVLYPFYRVMLTTFMQGRTVKSSAASASQSEITGVDAIGEREQAARNALQEVELDYQLGNISDEDYNILRERYMRRALVALKSRYEQRKNPKDDEDSQVVHENDTPDYDQRIDELIEEELRRLREQRKPQALEASEQVASAEQEEQLTTVSEPQEQENKKDDAGN